MKYLECESTSKGAFNQKKALCDCETDGSSAALARIKGLTGGRSRELWWQAEHVSLQQWLCVAPSLVSAGCWSLMEWWDSLWRVKSIHQPWRQRTDGSGIILLTYKLGRRRDTFVCKEQQTTDMASCPKFLVLCLSNTSQQSQAPHLCLFVWLFDHLIMEWVRVINILLLIMEIYQHLTLIVRCCGWWVEVWTKLCEISQSWITSIQGPPPCWICILTGTFT